MVSGQDFPATPSLPVPPCEVTSSIATTWDRPKQSLYDDLRLENPVILGLVDLVQEETMERPRGGPKNLLIFVCVSKSGK